MKNYIKIIAVLVALLVIAWLVSMGGVRDESVKGPIKIGVSTILSGDWAALGDNIVKTVNLAVAEVNENGGINGRMFEVLVQDAGVDSKTGLAAAQKLINTDGVRYIIGGTSSNGTMAAAPLVNEKKAVYLTPVTGGSNVDGAGEYIFRVANSDVLAGRDLANVVSRLGHKKVATVTEVTEYTLDIKKKFEETYKLLGGSVAVSEEFQPGTTDFRTIVAKVKAASPEAVLILSQTGTGGAHFMKQAREAGVKTEYFSDFTFVTNDNAKKIVGSFEGVYFADPAYDATDKNTLAFFGQYESTYKAKPLIPFHAASAYDSVMMIADAIRAVGDDSEKVHDWLLVNVTNRKGLMGTFSLDQNGNSDLGFVIRKVKGGQFVEVNY